MPHHLVLCKFVPMLNALTVALDGDESGMSRAARSMTQQGFTRTNRIDWPGGMLDGWSNAAQASVTDCIVQSAAGRACCIGPIWYRGTFGKVALRHLLDEIDDQTWIDETQLHGNFAMFLCKEGKAWLFNDSPGFLRIYSSEDKRYYSTSWLATRAYAGSANIHEAAAIEYVLLGATHSDQTVAPSVSKLPLGCTFDLGKRCITRRFPDGISAGARRFTSINDGVESIASHLSTVFAEIATAFPGKSVAALSGGFDSRLIVAGLVASGVRPQLFVYGNDGSQDVTIAMSIAQAESLPLRVVDKDAMNAQLPAATLETLTRNALFFDGLSNDGVLDSGADRATRLMQSAEGAIALNGGGGEIFRNFFHLPGGRFHAIDLVHAFYRGFDASVFRRAGGLESYEVGLATSIARSIINDPSMSYGNCEQMAFDHAFEREQIELIYPLFRCHHWMGLNNSIALRCGYFATPLIDLTLLRDASMLPLVWKNAGLFESRLIAQLHPRIARHVSAYGFRFSEGPDRRARWNEWITSKRPVFARPAISALRRKMRPTGASRTMIAKWRGIMKGEWRLDQVLDLERLHDDASFSRALAVEVVSRALTP